MIPLVDSTKTTGLIFFPGTMVGMLVAGAEPLDAVRLQLILLYLVLGAVATSSLLALVLVRRRLVEPGERIRELTARPSEPSVR
ncbi:putative iron export permease protein FetB [bacterium HR41]|nr:putative iron export permease protein FetB [bacterium HR41]